MGRSAAAAVKKQSSDWSSSGWDADDSWSNEKEGQGQSSAGEDGWGNDWGDEDTDTTLASTTLPLPEGVRLASDYNWEGTSTAKGGNQSDLFGSLSQRAQTGSASATPVRTGREKQMDKISVGFHLFDEGMVCSPRFQKWLFNSAVCVMMGHNNRETTSYWFVLLCFH